MNRSDSTARFTAIESPYGIGNEQLASIAAAKCCEQVMRYAGHKGFMHSDFVTRVPIYRTLPQGWHTQFRALTLLAKMPDISSTIGAYGGWHFYARALAPAGAFNIRDAVRHATHHSH